MLCYIVQIYETRELSEEKVRALRVLGHVKDADRMEQVLKFSISVSHVYLIINYTLYPSAHNLTKISQVLYFLNLS